MVPAAPHFSGYDPRRPIAKAGGSAALETPMLGRPGVRRARPHEFFKGPIVKSDEVRGIGARLVDDLKQAVAAGARF